MKLEIDNAKAQWIRYDCYEWKTSTDGILYLTATKDAKPDIYDPLSEATSLVLEALAIGKLCMSRATDAKIQQAMLPFFSHYGLFGLMTALPTTADFMDYEAVYLPKNHFIKAETMTTESYLDLFFPFDAPKIQKNGIQSCWDISNDPIMTALALTMSDQPMAVNLCFQKGYAERYDWLKQQLTDWYFTFTTSVLYYEAQDMVDENLRTLYQQSMAAFHGNAPTYHIALLDKPTLLWDFHSLLLCVQWMFSLMLTDDEKPLRLCKVCTNAFFAHDPTELFCSEKCKERKAEAKR